MKEYLNTVRSFVIPAIICYIVGLVWVISDDGFKWSVALGALVVYAVLLFGFSYLMYRLD